MHAKQWQYLNDLSLMSVMGAVWLDTDSMLLRPVVDTFVVGECFAPYGS